MPDWLLTVCSFVMSAVITWWVARHYYLGAAKDLEHVATRQGNLLDTILRAMEHNGWVTLSHDHAGNITGFEQIAHADVARREAKAFPVTAKPGPITVQVDVASCTAQAFGATAVGHPPKISQEDDESTHADNGTPD